MVKYEPPYVVHMIEGALASASPEKGVVYSSGNPEDAEAFASSLYDAGGAAGRGARFPRPPRAPLRPTGGRALLSGGWRRHPLSALHARHRDGGRERRVSRRLEIALERLRVVDEVGRELLRDRGHRLGNLRAEPRLAERLVEIGGLARRIAERRDRHAMAAVVRTKIGKVVGEVRLRFDRCVMRRSMSSSQKAWICASLEPGKKRWYE